MKPLNQYIDHTNLKPSATRADIEKLCAEARAYGFASVCVHPCNLPLCRELLAGSGVKLCTVIGFPLGQNTTAVKVAETEDAYAMGCDEFDMVINVGRLKDGDTDFVRDEIAAVVAATRGSITPGVSLKASAGIRTFEDAAALIEAGADRIGTSAGVAIMAGAQK